MQAVLPDIESLGASLIVLSPQLQEFTKPGAERHKLTFPILTDPDNKVGEAYGLAFRLPDDLIGVYKANGIDLAKFNGDDKLAAVDPRTHRDPRRRHGRGGRGGRRLHKAAGAGGDVASVARTVTGDADDADRN